MRCILVCAVLIGSLARGVLADEVELRSGVILSGEAFVEGDEVRLVLPSGGQMTLPQGLVKNLRQDGVESVAFAPVASPAPTTPLPAFQPDPVPVPAPPPPTVPAPPAYVPSSPPPPPPPGGVYERQGMAPLVVHASPPAPCAAPAPVPCAAPCPPPCDPCAPDPCDPCDPPCPDLGPWSVNLNLSWTQAGGNSDSLSLKVDFEVVYEKDPWKWATSGFYAYVESGGSVDTNRFFVESQLDRKLTYCSYLFVKGSYDTNEPADLDYRVIGTVGYGRSIIKQEKTTLDAEVGLGGTWEKRSNLSERFDPSAYLGLDFMRDFGRAGKFTLDYDFLPNLNDFDLSIMRFDAKYTLPIWKCLNFFLGLRVDWQFEPEDPTVEEIDWIASVGLGISF